MRVVFKSERLICGVSVPEFFVTHVGFVQSLAASATAITFCQEDAEGLIPVARLIWPIERLMEVNPLIARQCLRATG